jgi:MFS family permease
VGFVLLSLGLIVITAGLALLREEPDAMGLAAVIGCIVAGLAILYGFGRWVLKHPDPAIDLRVMRQPSMWPVLVTAGLFGISVLGAQAPLTTYAGTDPALGYGLGLESGARSILIGVYLISIIVGALVFSAVSKRLTPRLALILATAFVALGYLLFLPFHLEVWQVVMNMAIAGIGSGALVAALPAAAAAAAPRGQTGIAAGMTNTTKTIGGAFASAIFGVVLVSGVTGDATAAPLAGYMTVWAICGIGALVAMVLLFFVPKLAFADVEAELLPAQRIE